MNAAPWMCHETWVNKDAQIAVIFGRQPLHIVWIGGTSTQVAVTRKLSQYSCCSALCSCPCVSKPGWHCIIHAPVTSWHSYKLAMECIIKLVRRMTSDNESQHVTHPVISAAAAGIKALVPWSHNTSYWFHHCVQMDINSNIWDWHIGWGWRTGCRSRPRNAEPVEELEESLRNVVWQNKLRWWSRGRCTWQW